MSTLLIKSKCMKILVLNINQTTVERGAETFWENLSKELRRRGADIGIISSSKAHLQNKNSGVIYKFCRRFYLDSYSFQVLFFTIKNILKIKKEKPNILIPTNGGWQLILARIFRPFLKYKIMIVGQSGIGHDDEFNLKFGALDFFVATTSLQKEWAKKISPKTNIGIIYNGVDLNEFSPSGKKKDFNLVNPIILCVAALEPYKNIDKTIHAVSKMEKASLVVVGCGQIEKDLQKMGLELLGPTRFLLLNVTHQEMPEIYRAAHVFTLVSGFQESSPLSYLEAMACGLPCVATNDQKRREIIGEAGIFVDPNNFEEYKIALLQSLNTNWKNEPHLQAEKFSWEIIGAKYMEEFSKLI
jgi:glycosyltransferase involved in cell wall biosynthesis